MRIMWPATFWLFQSTHPVRGATVDQPGPGNRPQFYFNPRTPCGVRRNITPPINITIVFQSTHPVRGATLSRIGCILASAFQSTHPVRGATPTETVTEPETSISIHAPRAGCDLVIRRQPWGVLRFQSTHPVRGATTTFAGPWWPTLFQSTHPVRGATVLPGLGQPGVDISIHAPRAGCDIHILQFLGSHPPNFNPRTPCGVRLRT
mgnify:CR=1 FL=1